MRAAIASIILGMLALTPARAEDTERAAQVHLDRGLAAYEEGDWTMARRELAIAVELVPHKPNPYRWLALAEIKLGQCDRARLDVDSFLARVDETDARIPELLAARDGCQQVTASRVDEAPVADAPAPDRVITKWWFWTAIGVTAAVITGAIIVATRDDSPTELPAISCNAGGCQ